MRMTTLRTVSRMALNDDGLHGIQLPAERERRAIVVVDVVESVRLMELDESAQIDRWRHFVEEAINEVLPPHNGRLQTIRTLGGSQRVLVESLYDLGFRPQAFSASASAVTFGARTVPRN